MYYLKQKKIGSATGKVYGEAGDPVNILSKKTGISGDGELWRVSINGTEIYVFENDLTETKPDVSTTHTRNVVSKKVRR